MQKIIRLFVIAFLFSSCSPVGKLAETGGYVSSGKDLEKKIKDNNISAGAFIITKAEMRIIMNGEERKVISNIKYDGTGTYLISIRSGSGIEALRILLTNDSIKANDRINRVFYLGKTDFLLKKYGVRKEMISILFGDIITSSNYTYFTECKNDEVSIKSSYKNYELRYVASCKEEKIISAFVSDPRTKSTIACTYGKFKKGEKCIFPQKGKVEIQPSAVAIAYNIKAIEEYSGEDISLIPGKNYDKIVLR